MYETPPVLTIKRPSRRPSEAQIKGLHVEHNDGDAFELKVNAHRLSAPGLRVMPATAVTNVTVEAPSYAWLRRAESSDLLRGPPGKRPVPARGPPV